MATTPQTNTTIAEIAQVIRSADDFVICGHVSPDGDCLGSQLTLWHALRAMGKNAACVLVRDEPIGVSLEFLPGVESMVPVAEYEGPCRVFIGVDVPSRERIGDAVALLDKAETSVTIDHHAADVAMCEHVYVDPQSASASILVWDLVKELVDEPPLESATCAYAGLMTDTGGFRFQNSDSRAFEAASELVSFGVDPSWISTQVFQSRTFASLKLEALVLERISLVAGGKAAMSWLTQADFEAASAIKADAEPLIDVIRSLHGTRMACMLREQDGVVRGSFRSKDDTDVSVLARELGGGGHPGAAGFTLEMTLEEAIPFVEGKISDLLDATGR